MEQNNELPENELPVQVLESIGNESVEVTKEKAAGRVYAYQRGFEDGYFTGATSYAIWQSKYNELLLHMDKMKESAADLSIQIEEKQKQYDELKAELDCSKTEYGFLKMSFDELKAENERLNDQNGKVHEKNRKLSTEHAALRAKAQRLVDALEWYADDGNYFGDNGELATAWKKNMAKKATSALKDWQNKEGVNGL